MYIIFTHVPKTGGTSIEKAFGFVVPDDAGKHANLTLLKSNMVKQGRQDFYNDAFKFTIVRNPFDWVASWYFYRKTRPNENNTKSISFKEWLIDEDSSAYNIKGIGLTLSQYDIISCDANIKIDFIGKYENLQEDFDIICDKIGIPHQQLPHKNATKHKHYTEYYDDETKSIVAEKYAKDIEYFNYKFGD